MGSFDFSTAVASQAQGGNLLASVGKGFGAPTCLTKLLSDALALLPMPVLLEINNASEEVQATIDSWMDTISQGISLDLGLTITITPNGQISVSSRNSKWGMGIPGLGALGQIAGFVNGMTTLGAGLYATGLKAYKNFQELKDCIEGFFNSEKFSGKNASEAQQSLSQAEFKALMDRKLSLIHI